MKTRKKQPLSIYIHIPFCKKKCLYCDFLSAPACGQERESYVRALLREIPLMAETCRDYEVVSVFFGGGTPSLLTKEQMKRIMAAVKKNYHLVSDAEISMECNPATATFDTLKAYKECGINRLSIGLQSANEEELKVLGRIHNYNQFLQTYEEARRAGFTNINIDLMSALPGQTLASYQDTLQKIIALNPEHISAYSLIIEEGTPFYEMSLELPDEDTERKMYHQTQTVLKKAGYSRYEISNYSKRGYECRHNLTYWTGVDYIGFGIGAASYFQGYRYKNTSDIQRYKEEVPMYKGGVFMPGEFPWHEEVQHLSVEERMEEFMFLGLRLKKGICEMEFQSKFGKTMKEVYPNVIETLLKEKLLLRKNNRLYLSAKGTDVANYVMAQFLLN